MIMIRESHVHDFEQFLLSLVARAKIYGASHADTCDGLWAAQFLEILKVARGGNQISLSEAATRALPAV